VRDRLSPFIKGIHSKAPFVSPKSLRLRHLPLCKGDEGVHSLLVALSRGEVSFVAGWKMGELLGKGLEKMRGISIFNILLLF